MAPNCTPTLIYTTTGSNYYGDVIYLTGTTCSVTDYTITFSSYSTSETHKQRTDRLSLEKLKGNIIIKFSEFIEDKKPIFNGRHQAYQKFYLSHLYH